MAVKLDFVTMIVRGKSYLPGLDIRITCSDLTPEFFLPKWETTSWPVTSTVFPFGT